MCRVYEIRYQDKGESFALAATCAELSAWQFITGLELCCSLAAACVFIVKGGNGKLQPDC